MNYTQLYFHRIFFFMLTLGFIANIIYLKQIEVTWFNIIFLIINTLFLVNFTLFAWSMRQIQARLRMIQKLIKINANLSADAYINFLVDASLGIISRKTWTRTWFFFEELREKKILHLYL